MSALDTRAHIQGLNQRYLCPLALTGKTADEISQWVQAANRGEYPCDPSSWRMSGEIASNWRKAMGLNVKSGPKAWQRITRKC